MTLVLASKFKNGVAFANDRLVYGGTQGIPKGLEDKVYILGNLAVGMSGNIVDSDECASGIAREYGMLLENAEPKALMHSLTSTRTGKRLQQMSWDLMKAFRESYLFGFMDNGEPKLFLYDDTETGRPVEREWEGIGFGMYPEVREYMGANFDPNKNLDEAVNFLNNGMQIAFRINRTNGDQYALSGLGFTVVTDEGIRRHQRQISDVELRFLLNQYGSQIGYGEQVGKESLIKVK